MFLSSAIWAKLEEANIESLNEFTDLFSRQIVERKKPKKKQEKPSKLEVIEKMFFVNHHN